jgi:hypothetical protein
VDFPAYREWRKPRKSLMTEKGIIRSISVEIFELGSKFIVKNKSVQSNITTISYSIYGKLCSPHTKSTLIYL